MQQPNKPRSHQQLTSAKKSKAPKPARRMLREPQRNIRNTRRQVKFIQPTPVIHTPKKQNKKKKEPVEIPWYEKLGSAAGAFAGKAGASIIKSLSGFGDYTVRSNSLLAQASEGSNGNELPMMTNTKVSNVIQHREYIGDIYGSSSAFSSQSFDINPGLNDTFPWLSPIANCFTAYRMLGMVLEYKSLSSAFSTTQNLGYVAIGTQYNVLDQPYLDKKSLENGEYSNSSRTSENLIHPIECAPTQIVLSELYVRSTTPTQNSDLRMYDMGRVTVATGGQTADRTIIGELWATYEVEFYQPRMISTQGPNIEAQHFGMTNMSASNPFGTAQTYLGNATLQGKVLLNKTYQFPATTTSGRYLCIYTALGPDTAGVVLPLFVNNLNCTVVDAWFTGNPYRAYAPETLVGAINMMMAFVIDIHQDIVNQNAQFDFNGGNFPGLCSGDFFITQIPPQVTHVNTNTKHHDTDTDDDTESDSDDRFHMLNPDDKTIEQLQKFITGYLAKNPQITLHPQQRST